MGLARKYTVNLDAELVEDVARDYGGSTTRTLNAGLEELKRQRAIRAFLAARGTMKVSPAERDEMLGKNDVDVWDLVDRDRR